MDYKLAKSQAVVGYHIWSVGQPEKSTEKLNTMSSQTLFSGFGLVSGNSLVGSLSDRVRSWVSWAFLFFFHLRLYYSKGLSSGALAKPGSLSNTLAGRALEECSRGTL